MEDILYSSTVIPNRGAWLEYETDANDVFYVKLIVIRSTYYSSYKSTWFWY